MMNLILIVNYMISFILLLNYQVFLSLLYFDLDNKYMIKSRKDAPFLSQ